MCQYLFNSLNGENNNELNMTTLSSFLNCCNKALELYDIQAEEAGMMGDIDTFDFYENEKKRLTLLTEKIKEELNVNSYVSVNQLINWLLQDENKEVFKVLSSALQMVKDDDEMKKRKIESELSYINLFFNNHQFNKRVGDVI